MSSSSVVPEDAKDEFWSVVEACLRRFHGMKPEAIRRKAGKLRDSIEQMTPGETEFFYHLEPFDIACDVAGEPLNVEEYRVRYLHIRDKAEANGTAKARGQGRRKVNVKD
jgi:hypothetical protein